MENLICVQLSLLQEVGSKMRNSFQLLYNSLNHILNASHEEKSVLFASCLLDYCNSAASFAFISQIILLIKLCNLGQRPRLCTVQTQILDQLANNVFHFVKNANLGLMLLQNT